jgi:hypothetical protein
LGFTGTRREAERIKEMVGWFLRERLKLELSEHKTLITHGRTEAARFLGYEIVVHSNDTKHDRNGHRSINGQIGLKVPMNVVRAKRRPYMRRGKPDPMLNRAHDHCHRRSPVRTGSLGSTSDDAHVWAASSTSIIMPPDLHG